LFVVASKLPCAGGQSFHASCPDAWFTHVPPDPARHSPQHARAVPTASTAFRSSWKCAIRTGVTPAVIVASVKLPAFKTGTVDGQSSENPVPLVRSCMIAVRSSSTCPFRISVTPLVTLASVVHGKFVIPYSARFALIAARSSVT
jgi:hypothetical protein